MDNFEQEKKNIINSLSAMNDHLKEIIDEIKNPNITEKQLDSWRKRVVQFVQCLKIDLNETYYLLKNGKLNETID